MLLTDSKCNQKVAIATADLEVMREALMSLDEVRLFHENFATWQAATSVSQHRKSHRVSIDRPLKITSLDGDPAAAVQLDANARDISPHGISFMCRSPLPFRRVVIEFPGTSIPRLISELTWCRFTQQKMYQCGGSFVGIYPDTSLRNNE